jgi:cytoskeletal protein CcmA (bactofilin family)
MAFPAASSEEDERARLSGSFIEEQFLAGEEVRVEDATANDIFAAGGEVEFDNVTARDVVVFAGSQRFRNTVLEDLIAAGGEIDISGEITGDLIAAGGRLQHRRESVVGGYAILAGGVIDLEGRIDGNLKAAAGRIRISGEVKGDVDLSAGRISVEPGARIGGRLTYRSREEAEIAPDALIEGGVQRREVEAFEVSLPAIIGIGFAVWLVALLGMSILGAVLHGAVPELPAGAVDTLRSRFWASLLLGFALLVAIPVAVNLLFVTLVGVPLGVVLFLLLGATVLPSVIVVAYCIGHSIARVFAWTYDGEGLFRRVLWSFTGLVVLSLVALIPLLGVLVLFLAVSSGLGALVLYLWGLIRSWRLVPIT